jgi:hypothetical protein
MKSEESPSLNRERLRVGALAGMGRGGSLLFEILRGELWGTGLSFSQLSHTEFEELMEMAGEQTVTGLVGDCLIKNNIKLERDDALGLYAKMKAIEKANARVNENLVSFVNFMERKGIDYIIVKGQVAGSFYPNPDARMSGDVDLYFVGDNYEKIKSLVEQRLGKQLSKLSDGKHVEFEVNGVIFELHDKLSRLATRKHQAYWDQMIDNAILEGTDTVMINGKEIKTLSATYNAMYIFVHLFYHMTASGVGLRQLCDWARVLAQSAFQDSSSTFQVKNDNVNANPNKKSSLNREDLGGSLKELGYFKAYKAMGAFLVEYLGLPEEQFPFVLTEKDRKWVETIKKNILKRGNFGRTGRKVKNLGVLHSMETGYLNMAQTLTFYRLAPKEVLLRFTSLGEWFMERFRIKKKIKDEG